jgi:hypothetical protein
MVVSGAHFVHVMVRRAQNPRPPADSTTPDLDGWREICGWVARNTPADALFITPRGSQTFRWYAGRAEVVGRKDIPQDAAGIVEWWRRMNDVYREPSAALHPRWHRSLTELGSRRLAQLGEKYGADYVITDASPRLALELVSPPNSSYAVYRLPRQP